jgi:hypothetical protein
MRLSECCEAVPFYKDEDLCSWCEVNAKFITVPEEAEDDDVFIRGVN